MGITIRIGAKVIWTDPSGRQPRQTVTITNWLSPTVAVVLTERGNEMAVGVDELKAT